jgi:hypothetical protein
MKLYLAGTYSHPYLWDILLENNACVLESFYYFKEWQTELFKHNMDFLLDSGAFTFINSPHRRIQEADMQKYTKNYIAFIKKHNIENYIEMDFDAFLTLQQVNELRHTIEEEVGHPSIPVWHKTRGFTEYKKLIQNYDYIALPYREFKGNIHVLKYFLKLAQKENTKVHGLAATGNEATKLPFYSVDSTSWIGGKFGHLYSFKNGTIYQQHPSGKRACLPHYELDRQGLLAYIQYQKYLRRCRL